MTNQKMKFHRIDLAFEKGDTSKKKAFLFAPNPLSPPVGCLSKNFVDTRVQDFYIDIQEDDHSYFTVEVNLIEGAKKSDLVCLSVYYVIQDASE